MRNKENCGIVKHGSPELIIWSEQNDFSPNQQNEYTLKEEISNRYECLPGGKLSIDVSVGRIEELFEDFDSAASYVKKDLDQDLVEYLIECVREIGNRDFVIRINLPLYVQDRHCQRVRHSMKNYFRYLEQLEMRKLHKMLWKSFLLFCFGMLLLTITKLLTGNLTHTSDVMQELTSEGLTVAAWVSLWSAFANLIFTLPDILGDIRTFRRIGSREVIFKVSVPRLHGDASPDVVSQEDEENPNQ